VQFINKEHTAQQEFGQNDGAIDGATKALKRKLAVLIKAIWRDEGKNTADYTADFLHPLFFYAIISRYFLNKF